MKSVLKLPRAVRLRGYDDLRSVEVTESANLLVRDPSSRLLTIHVRRLSAYARVVSLLAVC